MKTLATVIRLAFLGLFILLVVLGKPMLWMGLFVVALITSLMFGRYYCGYICPMNTVMRPVNWLANKLKIQTKTTPKWLASGKLGWVFLALSALVVVIARQALKMNFPFLIVWLVLAALVTLRYRPAVFHNLICPFGAPLKQLGHYSRNSQQVHKDECISCGKCLKPCPSQAITIKPGTRFAVIDKQICHQCQDCRAVCPVDAIHYEKAV